MISDNGIFPCVCFRKSICLSNLIDLLAWDLDLVTEEDLDKYLDSCASLIGNMSPICASSNLLSSSHADMVLWGDLFLPPAAYLFILTRLPLPYLLTALLLITTSPGSNNAGILSPRPVPGTTPPDSKPYTGPPIEALLALPPRIP